MSSSERDYVPRRRRRRWPILPCILVSIWGVLAAARTPTSTMSPAREATLAAEVAEIATLEAHEKAEEAKAEAHDIREGHSPEKAEETAAKANIAAGVAILAAAEAVNAAQKTHEKGKEADETADKAAEVAVLEADQAIREASDAGVTVLEAEKEATSIGSTVPWESTEVPTTKETHLSETIPTFRPRRQNCTPPAIEQFPHPIMGRSVRRHGGLIIHVLVAIYTFIGLAIVCDHYFVTSLDRICEELKLSPDVAGATFMAAGSSAPELATVIIGVFFAKDDIGLSGVIGSAVFNIMFVISVCALCTSTVCYLNWWPMIRDCFFYSLAILIMLITIFDDMISWGEALFMLIVYVIYCIALHFNPRLEAWAQTLPVPCKRQPEEESALVTYKTLSDDKNKPTNYTDMNSEGTTQTTTTTAVAVPEPALNFHTQTSQGWGDNWGDGFPGLPQEPPPPPPVQQHESPTSGPVVPQRTTPPPQQAIKPQGQEIYKSKEPNTDEPSPLLRPTEEEGKIALIRWYIVYPIHYLCITTMPDCKAEKYRRLYPLTFVISMIWISFFSYIMVWMITIIGSTLSIPDTVMGLTFVAAGVSVPDALSSLAVVKEGYGDMAVSNAVGSNVFDILICLGLPWFIQTAIIKPGSRVHVYSKGLTYSTLSLLSTVVFLVVSTHINGWKLDKKLGIILMIWYLLFITFASLYELNAFGFLNPEVCPSSY